MLLQRLSVDGEGVAIGGSNRLLRDTGARFLLRVGDEGIADRYDKGSRVDLLVSTSDIPNDLTPTINETGNIDGDSDILTDKAWEAGLSSHVQSVYDHLVANEVSYIQPTEAFDTNDPIPPVGRGLFGSGWRGAYLSPVVGPDPWGFRYAVNSVYLGTATNAGDSDQGQRGVGWVFDTVWVSAGADSQIETLFEDELSNNQNGGTSFDGANVGDDIVFTISGYGQ